MPKLNIARYATAVSTVTIASLFGAALAKAEEARTETAASHIIVTALRTPVEANTVAASITILDAEDIEREQPISIDDVLVRTPGISLTRNGGYGTATSLRIRGADSGHTVLVIDGMRLADPSSSAGGYNFANLFTGDTQRIEVLRGPQSILWGSDAIGGVVNIVTARPTKPIESSFQVEAGSRDTVNARAGIGGKSKLIGWRLSGSTFATDGISASNNGTEKDGYKRNSATGTIEASLAPNVTLDLRGYYADARNEFDSSTGDSPAYGTTEEYTVYAGLHFALLDGRLTNRLAILDSSVERKNYDPRRTIRPLNFDADGDTRRYEYQGSFAGRFWDTTFGAEREEQKMFSASPGNNSLAYSRDRNSADINSLYAQVRVTPIAPLTLSGGVRYDEHSNFGENALFSAGAAFAPGNGSTVLRASYDEGFKAPSLYQLFSLYGSDALQPEEAKGWEFGAEQSLFDRRVRLSATYFERDTDNLIDFAYCPSAAPLPAECFVPGTTTSRFGYYANVRRTKARGVELAGSATFGNLSLGANYSWIESEDASGGATDGMQLARVPRHLANASIGYRFDFGLTVDIAMRYAGESFDRLSTTAAVLDDYWLTDIRADLAIAPEFSLFGRVENLFDANYETAGGYGTLGRSIYAGIRGRF